MAEERTQKRAIVTGAAGFVGSAVCRELVDNGYEVTAFVRASSSLRALEQLPIRFAEGDITDEDSLLRAFPGHDYVFHIAALFRETTVSDEDFFRVNLGGTQSVLKIAEQVGIKRLIYCSTTGVTGDIKNPPGDETSPYAPRDVYQRSKTAAEKYLLEASKASRTEIVVIRPIMIWGPGDTRLGKLFTGIRAGRMPILGDGKTLFHFVLVSDLARGFRLAAESPKAPGNVYLIGGREILPITDVFKIIAEEVGGRIPPFRIPLWPVMALAWLCESVCKPLGIAPPIYPRRVDFYAKNRAFSCKKAKEDLSYEAHQSFRDEVKLIADWYRAQGLFR